LIFGGKRIAKQGTPGTAHAMSWISLEPGVVVRDVPMPESESGWGMVVEINSVRVHERVRHNSMVTLLYRRLSLHIRDRSEARQRPNDLGACQYLYRSTLKCSLTQFQRKVPGILFFSAALRDQRTDSDYSGLFRFVIGICGPQG
jgi:hypothetical protein